MIGAALLSREMVARLVPELLPTDFVRPAHALAWAAIRDLHLEGFPVDALTVASKTKGRPTALDFGALLTMQSNVPAISHAVDYATLIRREASARRSHQLYLEAVARIERGDDANDVADATESALRKLDRAGMMPERFWPTTAEYLSRVRETGKAVLDGIINERGRTLVLADEKAGKSTLLRQFGECVGSGLHPWEFSEIDPIPTLLLDVENDDDELEPALLRLDKVLSARLGPARPRPALFSQPWTLDLRSRAGRSQLEEVLEEVRPRLIIGGPIVNFYERRKDEKEDEIISDLKAVFNDIRRRWGCALMLEHHSVTDRRFGLRSKGGQAWSAWTNATIGLYSKNGGEWVQVKHEHAPRGDIRWPTRFTRGTRPDEFPWMPSPTVEHRRFHREGIAEQAFAAREEKIW